MDKETKSKILIKAKEIILEIGIADGRDNELMSCLSDLKVVVDEFYNLFNFPYGSKKFGRDSKGNKRTINVVLGEKENE